MKKPNLTPAMLLTGIAIVLGSCLEELENTDKIGSSTFQPAIEFPLINSDFSMGEFLTEGSSKAKIVEQSGVMVLTYDDSIATATAESFFTLPDQQSPTLSINGPEVTFPSPGSSVTITKDLTFNFNPAQGEALDSILLKAGQLSFLLNSNFPANITLTIALNSLKFQGVSFEQSFNFVGPGSQNPSFDLQGALFDLTDNGTPNTLSFSITAIIQDTGQPIDGSHQLDCSFDLQGLQFRALFGDLGTQALPALADSIDIDIFSNATSGSVEFLSPAISLRMNNSFGIPLGFGIQNISAINNNTTEVLSGAVVEAPANPYRLDAPLRAGAVMSTTIDVNSTNSNLADLISAFPDYIPYEFNLSLNPAPVQAKSFVLDDSRLSIALHVELPFHGAISGFSLSKEYPFNGLGIDEITQGKITLRTSNELPLDASVQVYFIDASGALLDSLFTDRSIIKSAAVDADGFTQGAAEFSTQISVDQAKIDRIEQAERLVVNAVLYTTGSGAVPVKFSTSDKLTVNLGVSTSLKYKIN